MLHKSIVLPAFFPNTVSNVEALIERLRFVAENSFYDTVEFYFEGSDEEKELIKSKLKQYKLNSIFLGAFYLKQNKVNLGDLREGNRKRAIIKTKGLIDEAIDFGSKKIMVVSGENPGSVYEQEISFNLLVRSLVEICKYAKKKSNNKLQITLEFFNNIGEPYLFVGPTSLALKLAQIVCDECDNFELTYDLSHVIQLKENQDESLQKLRPYVNHIHLANCVTKFPESPLYGDKHPPFNLEQGDVDEKDLKDFINTNDVGDIECIGMEVITTEVEKEDYIFYSTIDIFRRILNKQ